MGIGAQLTIVVSTVLVGLVQPASSQISQTGRGLGQTAKESVFVDQKNGYFTTMVPISRWNSKNQIRVVPEMDRTA